MNYLDAGTIGLGNVLIERSRTVSAGDLDGSGVLVLDLNDSTCAPVLVLDAGLTLNGIEIRDANTSVMGAFADGMTLTLRTASGSATLAHESVTASASLRFKASPAANVQITPVGQRIQYRTSDARWYVGAVFSSTSYTGIIPLATPVGASLVAASSGWVARTAKQRIHYFDDFLPGIIASDKQWAVASNGTNATTSANTSTFAGRPGARFMVSGSQVTGRTALSFESVSGQLPFTAPWADGVYRQETSLRLGTLPDTGSGYVMLFGYGFGAATNNDELTSGIGLCLSNASPNWQFITRSGGADGTVIDTGIAASALTWITLAIELDGATARAYIGPSSTNLTLVGTTIATTGIFAGAAGPLLKLRNLSAVSHTHAVDYIEVDYTLNTSR